MNTKQLFILVVIIAIGIGVLVYFNQSKENTIADPENYSWVADMETGEVKNDPLPDIQEKLRKRIPVNITFRGIDARNGNFEKMFSTEDICSSAETKEERRKWWNQTGKKELEVLKKEFSEWKVDKNAFRSYAIAVDITEGWNGQFSLEEILSEEDILWIEGNEFSLDIFAIGYNEVPGKRSIKKGNIETIEKTAKSFLSQAPKKMPETKLLTQISYIFKKNYYKVVCITDLMEHTKQLSAYKYGGEEVDFSTYFPDTDSYPKNVVIRVMRSDILGIDAKRQSWYDTFEEGIQEIYPETAFSFE
jgi:hypothetical protein